MKRCFKCGQEKELDEFYVHKEMADGRLGKCKKCTKRDVSDHRGKNIESIREYDRRRSGLPHRRQYQLRKYGITIDDYNKMLNDQNGVCAICGKTNITRRRLAIDHNHKTGKVRGLLCHRCNNAIGLFDENLETLKKAIKYLKMAMSSVPQKET